MKSIDLKRFRKDNNLSQADIATYLEVSTPFISRVESGKNKLPEDKIVKLINNPYGWKVDALVASDSIINGSGVVVTGSNNHHIDNRHYYSDSPDVLRAQIELLDERIKEKDAQIKEKDAQIKSLLEILAKK